MRYVLLLVLVGCGASSPESPNHASGHPGAHKVKHEHHAGHNHDFSDVDAFAQMFDDPERDAWQKPDEVVQRMQLAPGMTVADLGAGTGYFLKRLSTAVGAEGKVFGLDVEPKMVEYMQQRIAKEGLGNAAASQVPYDSPGLDAGSTDRVLIVNTWHHIENREAYAAKLKAALKPGGKIVIVDFTLAAKDGPPMSMRLVPAQVIRELEAGGLEAEQVEETLPNQYIVMGE